MDLQSKSCANLKLLGQPCNFYATSTEVAVLTSLSLCLSRSQFERPKHSERTYADRVALVAVFVAHCV
jgi:hypothetical protein